MKGKLKTYKLIWWNSSCSCNSISARSDSVEGILDSELPWLDGVLHVLPE